MTRSGRPSGHAEAMAPAPDFVIIGAMKAGTTSLFRWLGEHPVVTLPAQKEPETLVRAGDPVAAYHTLFSDVPEGHVTGEASARYGHPDHIAVVAAAVARLFSATTLIYLLRDPEDRLRSHYRHEMQRGREHRSLAEATADPASAYRAHSRYADVIAAVHDRLGPDRLLVIGFEALTTDDGHTWRQVLDTLGLAAVDRPDTAHNVSDTKGSYRPWMRRIYDTGLADRTRSVSRRLGPLRRLFIDDSEVARRRLDEAASAPLDAEVTAELEATRQQVPTLVDAPLW